MRISWFLVVLLLIALAVPATATTRTLDQAIASLPATIKFYFSGPVSVSNATLYLRETEGGREYLSQIASFGSEDFHPSLSDDNTYTITIPSSTGLTRGNYTLIIWKSDSNPPFTSSTDQLHFTYRPSSSGLLIELANLRQLTPFAGFSETRPFNATFTTNLPARCRSSLTATTSPDEMAWFPSENATSEVTTHTLYNLSFMEANVLVWCNTTDHSTLQRFSLGSEIVPPHFTITTTPAVVVSPDDPSVNFSVESDQKVSCVVTGDGQNYSLSYPATPSMLAAYQRYPFHSITFTALPATKITKQFVVTCTDRAGRAASHYANVAFDLQLATKIALASPNRYTSDSAPTLTIETRKGLVALLNSWCTYTLSGGGKTIASGDLSSDDGLGFSAQLPSLVDGTYSVAATCQLVTTQDRVSGTVAFTVDTEAPQDFDLTVPSFVCGNEPFVANLSLPEDVPEEPNLAGFNYTITYGTRIEEKGVSSSRKISSSFDNRSLGTYLWTVIPVDKAGNEGSSVTGTTTLYNDSNPVCDRTPPLLNLTIDSSSTPVIATLTCDDNGGTGCNSTFRYSIIPYNARTADCVYNDSHTYGQPLSLFSSGLLCYQGVDLMDNEVRGAKRIEVDDLGLPLCFDSHKDSDETDVDCGGSCQPCGAHKACVLDSDCTSLICDPTSKTCTEPSCSDSVRNGAESDVDCGGSCDSCSAGKACGLDSDCASAFCDPAENICLNVSCSDGLKNGHETDVDCGGATCGSCPDGGYCSVDTDCSSGTCEGGFCVEMSAPVVDEPTPSGFSTFGLILLILGLLVMGGSGYWLTLLHKEDLHDVAPQPLGEEPVRQGMDPAQRFALLQQRRVQLETLRRRREARQHHAEEKNAERVELLKSFGGDASSAASGDGTGTHKSLDDTSPRGVASTRETASSSDAEEFIPLDDVGKKPASPPPSASSLTSTSSTSDASRASAEHATHSTTKGGAHPDQHDVFSDLDSLITDDQHTHPETQEENNDKDEARHKHTQQRNRTTTRRSTKKRSPATSKKKRAGRKRGGV